MAPEELSELSLLAALDGARIVFFDGRLHETALVVHMRLSHILFACSSDVNLLVAISF